MKNILTKEGEMSIDFEDNLYQDAKISDVGLPTYWGHHENDHFEAFRENVNSNGYIKRAFKFVKWLLFPVGILSA